MSSTSSRYHDSGGFPSPENFNRTLIKKFEPLLGEKISRGPCCEIFNPIPQERKPLTNPPEPPPKTTLFQTLLPLQSGHVSGSVHPKYPNKAQNEPRLSEDHPLIDRKLLDILYEEGVRKKGGNSLRWTTRGYFGFTSKTGVLFSFTCCRASMKRSVIQ
jgi:hypothetical protein